MPLTPIQMGARVYFSSIGRFAQVDPILGGAANNYVYALDPINSNDFSGMNVVFTWTVSSGWCLQSCSTAGKLQPAKKASSYQPTINANRIQNAATVVVQGKWNPPRTISITVSPKAPAKNNSTAMPKATVNPIKSAVSSAWNKVLENGYINLSIGGNYWVAGGIGWTFSKEGTQFYIYGGVAGPPGPDFSLTFSTDEATCGWQGNSSYFYYVGTVLTGRDTAEYGVGTLGASLTGTYAFC